MFDKYRVFYQQDSDLDLACSFLTTRLEKAESIIFVAETDQQQVLGLTQLFSRFSSVSAQRTWVLNDLYVLPENQGLGIGTHLLNQARKHATHTEAKGLFFANG